MAHTINLDEDTTLITKATFIQDIRDVHSKCTVEFPVSDELNIIEGDVFILWGQEWEAVSYKELTLEGSYSLSVIGYPKSICSLVTTKYLSLSALAQGMSLAFDSDISSDFSFEFPLRNIPLCHLLFKYRYSSLEQNKDNLGNAWFLFCDGRGLYGQTYAALCQSSPLELDTELSRFTGGSYTFIQDYLNVRYESDHHPSRQSYKGLSTKLFGDKFDFQNSFPCIIGQKYVLKGTEEEKFSKYDNLCLIRQKYDSERVPLSWTLTFGQLEI